MWRHIICLFMLLHVNSCYKTQPLKESGNTLSFNSTGGGIKGVWVNYNIINHFDSYFEHFKKLGINRVYFIVYCGMTGEDLKNVKNKVKRVVSEGMKAIAWFEDGLKVYSHNGEYEKERLQQTRSGETISTENESSWLTPNHPQNLDYLKSCLTGILDSFTDGSQQLFSEVMLDRFRWGRKGKDSKVFGYEEASIKGFQKSGQQIPTETNSQWVQYRKDSVTQLVGKVAQFIKGKYGLPVSASPVGHYGVEQHMQDWRKWLDNGVSYVAFQAYNNTLGTFTGHVNRVINYAGSQNKSKISAGIASYYNGEKLTSNLMKDQIQKAARLGLNGYVLFTPTVQQISALAKALGSSQPREEKPVQPIEPVEPDNSEEIETVEEEESPPEENKVVSYCNRVELGKCSRGGGGYHCIFEFCKSQQNSFYEVPCHVENQEFKTCIKSKGGEACLNKCRVN